MTDDIKDVPDIRHRVRQLRWFKASFRHDARLISQRHNLAFDIDDRRLTEAFLNWAEEFSNNRPYAHLDRRDFVTFAAGLLLKHLLLARPVAAREAAPPTATAVMILENNERIAQSWPEGYLYTNYCLCILSAILDQEGMSLTLPALADDLRTWWSYRENTGEDPSSAIAFLDLFVGNEPNWFMPGSITGRSAMQRAIKARVLPAGGSGGGATVPLALY